MRSRSTPSPGPFTAASTETDKEQLDRVAALAGAVTPELVAKTAIYCRESARMKDMPAFLVAQLAATSSRPVAPV